MSFLFKKAKMDLVKKLKGGGCLGKAVDDWFDQWVWIYHAEGKVEMKTDEPYEDDPVYLERVRRDLKKQIMVKIVEEEKFEETADIDRRRRIVTLKLFLLKDPG